MITTYEKLLELYNNNVHKINLAIISIKLSEENIETLTEENDEIKELLGNKVDKKKFNQVEVMNDVSYIGGGGGGSTGTTKSLKGGSKGNRLARQREFDR